MYTLWDSLNYNKKNHPLFKTINTQCFVYKNLVLLFAARGQQRAVTAAQEEQPEVVLLLRIT